MNIFLDSNILYHDYFFENKSNRKLLEYCKEGLINLYMAEIVKLELRRQFMKEIEEINTEIKRIKKDASRLRIENEPAIIPIDAQLKKFDDFYKKLPQNENYQILPYSNDFLPDIINRAVYRKKPFTEEKSELKDALIWKTYYEFVETNVMSNCILLTDNTSDFCSKKDSSKIHSELLADTNRFTVINKSFEFVKLHGPHLESPENKFQIYFNTIEINEEFVITILIENFKKLIESSIHKKIDTMHPSDILSNEYIFDGQLVGHGCEILDCDFIEYEVIGDRALISGTVFAAAEVEVWQYNPARDPGEDRYSTIAERDVVFRIQFNFDMRMEEAYSDFEITDINVNSIH
ncbi:PIN domain-containing protein [Chryseobacterium tongliaoense]|uniref:PIN domain-containing protein n=1 Tax=Chryseobacterium tongliaoense TaxID=3240933 RepID=UPI0035115D37